MVTVARLDKAAARVIVGLFRRHHSWLIAEKWKWLIALEAKEAKRRADTEARVGAAMRARAQKAKKATKQFMKEQGYGKDKARVQKFSRKERALAVLIHAQRGWPGMYGASAASARAGEAEAHDEAGWKLYYDNFVVIILLPRSFD